MSEKNEWGEIAKGDFTKVPMTFFYNYALLRITPEEAMFILVAHYLDNGQGEFCLRVKTIASVMNKSTSSVRGYIRSLRNKKLLETTPGEWNQKYDFSLLYAALFLAQLQERKTG